MIETTVIIEYCRESRRPVIDGPMNPPRFPMELIRPNDAAAADAPNVLVGRTQNVGGHAMVVAAVSASQVMINGKGWPGIAESGKKMAPASNGTTQWSLRSLLRSEDLPARSPAAKATMKGSAASAVAAETERSDFILMMPGSQT